MQISQRAQTIEPFFVMEVAKAALRMAEQLSQEDWPMIYLNIGEPDFTAAPSVQQRAVQAIEDGQTQYTPALGIEPLRQCVSKWYETQFGLHVPSSRICITSGASSALQLACLALIEPGDEILMPDPSYPCNRHFITACGGRAKLIGAQAENRLQLSLANVQDHWGPKTKGVLLASPSNPTGTSIALDELEKIHAFVKSQNGVTLVDEIYLGLSFQLEKARTALVLDEDIVSINSFSKYFNMTGWRLGWLVTPAELVSPIERLAQNLYICPSAIAQHAALGCFEPQSLALFEQRKSSFKERRDYLVKALLELGFEIPALPDGAFYVWANCQKLYSSLGVNNSWDFTFELMKRTHIAVAPGRDFGQNDTEHFIRLSTASSMTSLIEAVSRMKSIFTS
ncbi:MAG: pyridoxal phosphate-dependent aminotransferase [Burkholderiaceae bacterium]